MRSSSKDGRRSWSLGFSLVVTAALAWAAPQLMGAPAAFGSPGQGNPSQGKALFGQYCASCHGPDGRGDGPAATGLNPKPANFHDPDRAAKMTPQKQIAIVSGGGSAQGLSPLMPAFSEMLSGQQIEDLIAYVRSLK